MASAPISKKSIDRAGITLRDWWSHELELDEDVLTDALGVLGDYRETFSGPLNSITMGVRSMVKTAGAEQVVSQRLKRIPTILDKLHRHPNMKVTRMQDIGGCRAILPDIETIYRVIERIRRSKQYVREIYDYIDAPKPTGYRGVHVVVERSDRLVEIQLRTQRQHSWATAIERLSGQPGFGRLKDGFGPAPAVDYYKVASRVIAVTELGGQTDTQLVAELAVARNAFRKLLEAD